MDIVANAIRGIGGLIGFAMRVFALVVLAINLLFGALLALLCFYIAADGSTTRGVVAVIVALLMTVVLSVVAGAAFSAALTAGKLVRDAGVGQKVFDEIFERLLGVTEETPKGDYAITKAMHGLTMKEVEAKINNAVDQLYGDLSPDVFDGSITGIAFWLARRVQRMVVWATVRVTVRQCRVSGAPDAGVDLVALRDKLSGRIDGLVLNFLRGHILRFFMAGASIVFVVALVLAQLISYLPI